MRTKESDIEGLFLSTPLSDCTADTQEPEYRDGGRFWNGPGRIFRLEGKVDVQIGRPVGVLACTYQTPIEVAVGVCVEQTISPRTQ